VPRLRKKSSYEIGGASAAKEARERVGGAPAETPVTPPEIDPERELRPQRLKPSSRQRGYRGADAVRHPKSSHPKFRRLCSRGQILVCAFWVLFWALPAAAQAEFGSWQMSMGGNLNTGYSGDLSNQQGAGASDHSLGLGGDGSLQGSYYNPNFLSFGVQPYYNRSQTNSGSASLFNNGGYTGNVNFFSGSHFPGTINFDQVWDSTGLFGIPGVAGLTTKDSSRGFGIGWSELVPDLPSLNVSFTRSSASSSVLGSDAQNDVAQENFGIHSAYRIKGWGLGAGFVHQISNTNSSGFLGSGEEETTDTSTNSYSFNAGHSLPLKGGFGIGFTRTDYNDTLSGATSGTNNGTTDNATANLNLQAWKLPVNATATYTDNVYGSFEQQILNNGGPLLFTSLSPESRALLVNVSTGYRVLPHVFVTGYVNRQELWLGDQAFGLTQFGANVNANFGNRFKGLTVTVGMNDSANRAGNLGASVVANANYTRSIGHWDFGASFGYDQNVQTLLAVYQTSSLTYTGRLQRRLPRGFSWSIGGGGGRSAFEQTAGNGSHSESVNSSMSWRGRYTVSGNYSKSEGSSVLTPGGLVPVPLPVISNNLVVFNGESYGFTFAASPVRAMTLSSSYSKSTSNTLGQNIIGLAPGLASNNGTQLISGLLNYRFRKLNFNASVIQFRQSISSSPTAPSSITTYFFGVSRWFKLF
jgi:hypothetical protein